MNAAIESTKKNWQIIREKSFLRRSLLAKSQGLSGAKDSVNCLLTKDEKQSRTFLRKVQKVKKTQNLKLFAENNEIRINEQIASFRVNNCGEFEDDPMKEEEYEGPKNDYNQYFVDISQRPQNFIRDPGLTERFEEYPKLRELIRLKDDLITRTNIPPNPMYLKSPLKTQNGLDFPLHDQIGCEFDVILVEPPLHEYQASNGVHFDEYFTWEQIKAIDVGSVAAQRSFIFLWCGSAEGLDKGRECLKKWGFRRCEDICWIKTNKKAPEHNRNLESGAMLQRTKEHCLMGIKGTVRRSQDSHFIHTNIDIDLIITEEPDYGRPDKPEEIFHIIEHFCLGKRRLYLFGRDSTIRPGWLTVGPELTQSLFDKNMLASAFEQDPSGNFTGSSDRIDMLRPKTPPLKQKQLALNSAINSGILNLGADSSVGSNSGMIMNGGFNGGQMADGQIYGGNNNNVNFMVQSDNMNNSVPMNQFGF